MSWIEGKVELHTCRLPEWWGGVVEQLGAMWGCEKCHRVHKVIGVEVQREGNKPVHVRYTWQVAEGLVYVEEKEEE